MPPKEHLLILGSNRASSRALAQKFAQMGYALTEADSLQKAQLTMETEPPDLIVLDYPLPEPPPPSVIRRWAREHSILSLLDEGQSLDDLKEAMRSGVAECLIKPIDLDTLSETVQRIIDHALLYREGDYYTRTGKGDPPSLLIGESPAIRQLRSDLRTLATSAATLLILGESGVGKGKIAEELHRLGPRASAPFIELDCCLLQETLLESELFGHERGAFTGAVQRKPGLIEQAQGGTLFLDEIGEIPATIQAKLLRLLETRRFRRLGGVEDLSADVRIIAATNRHLESMVESGEYRQDLYFRLNTLCLVAPPLRERPEDILPLADHFLRQTARSQQSVKRLHLSTQEILLRHDWPGNVRELRNVMERAATLSGHRRRIDPEHLGLTVSHSKPAAPVLALNFDHLPTLDELEQTYLEWLMERHQGHRADIARILGIGERTLYRKLAESHTSPKAITPPEKEE